MGKKSFRLGERIITTLASKVDGDIADDRPIGGSIIITQRRIVEYSRGTDTVGEFPKQLN
jgi:hypothetical protein